jgi:dTDP-4-dehydrorhamnose 3,5-epimerase
VTCASGAIIDVVVDLRVGSPGLGRWQAVRLDDTTRRAIFISEGLGHAFAALTDQATVMYLCSTPYAPGREHGVHPLDSAIGIGWPAGTERILSGKDASAPSLAEAQSAGLLPRLRQVPGLHRRSPQLLGVAAAGNVARAVPAGIRDSGDRQRVPPSMAWAIQGMTSSSMAGSEVVAS